MARLSIEYLFEFVCYGDSLLVVDTWVACKQYRFSNYSVFVVLVLLIEPPPPCTRYHCEGGGTKLGLFTVFLLGTQQITGVFGN